MKKILIFIFTMSMITACYNKDPRETVDDPSKKTTVYLQDLPKDTVLMSINDGTLYIFDKEDVQVIVQTKTNKDNSLPINLLVVFGSIMLLLFLIGTLLENIFKK
jgi:hypothetical protein